MKVRDLLSVIEAAAPFGLAEEWDNAGLLVGDPGAEVERVAVCLDVWPATVEEAAREGCNVLVSHHPLIFRPLRRVRRGDYVSDTLSALVSRGMNYIAAHTNADFALASAALAEACGARMLSVLKPVEGASLFKLSVFVPEGHREAVLEAAFGAGAGKIGAYSHCSFYAPGTGTFKGGEGTNPFIGEAGKFERTAEERVEVVVPANLLDGVLRAVLKAHPYEEPAYDVYPLHNRDPRYGFGVAAELPRAVERRRFVEAVKEALGVSVVRAAGPLDGPKVRRVGFAAGSAFDCYGAALAAGCQVFVTGEAGYHDLFHPAHKGFLTLVVGHGPSEMPVARRLHSMLNEAAGGDALFIETPFPFTEI